MTTLTPKSFAPRIRSEDAFCGDARASKNRCGRHKEPLAAAELKIA
jgi:hypothetical protein